MVKNSRISTGTAATWEDPEVRRKRQTRHAAEVNGITYRSFRAALLALGLSDRDHIRVRAKFKAAGDQGFLYEGYRFFARRIT